MTGLKTICVIDDDDIYQLTFKNDLKKLDHFSKIIFFSDGEVAINFFRDAVNEPLTLPDVVFLDINMPIMDGWDFIEAFIILKPNFSKTIVIYMVSSSINPRDVHRAKRISEISDYLVKPILRDTLNDILKKLTTINE